eukprot:11177385-Lingulodinium_polyedra.AAC.1
MARVCGLGRSRCRRGKCAWAVAARERASVKEFVTGCALRFQMEGRRAGIDCLLCVKWADWNDSSGTAVVAN